MKQIYSEGPLTANRLDDGSYQLRHKTAGSVRLGVSYLPAVLSIARDLVGVEADALSDVVLAMRNQALLEELTDLRNTVISLKTANQGMAEHVRELKEELEVATLGKSGEQEVYSIPDRETYSNLLSTPLPPSEAAMSLPEASGEPNGAETDPEV